MSELQHDTQPALLGFVRDAASGFTHDAALMVAGALQPQHMCSKYRLTPSELGQALTLANMDGTVDQLAAEMHTSGELAKVLAVGLLGKGLKQLHLLADSGELGANTLARVTETAHKVSGLKAPDKQPAQSSFSIRIDLGGAQNIQLDSVIDLASTGGGAHV